MEYPVIEKRHSKRKAKEEVLQKVLDNPFAVLLSMGGLSLYEFIQVFWNEIVEDEFKTNWHIEYLCKELEEIAGRVGNREKKLYDLIINIPPGTTKTIVCSIMFPVWCWTKWPWMRFITGSYSSDLSLESAEKSRDIMRSDKFALLYPNIFIKENKNTKSNYRIAIREVDEVGRKQRTIFGGGRFSTSVGGTITGFHGHINIWDDPINPKQAVSESMLNTANNWVDQSASTRKADKEVSVTIMVMQRLHQKDPTGHLLDKKDKIIRHICLPGEIRNYREQLNPPELEKFYKDELLDPTRLSWKSLKEMEADLGVYGYAGQVGQHPTPPGGGMFKVANFQIIDSLPNAISWVARIRYWDKAGTEGAGKRTAGVKMIRLMNNHVIIIDVRKGQWAAERREQIIKQTALADGREFEIGIEQEPGSGGKESAEATVRNLAGFVVKKDLPHGDKVYRAEPFAVQVNEGNIMLLRGEWNHEFIEEFRFFPFGNFKDQVDATAAGFNLIMQRRTARRIT
jgi:predicted phage terminase large subunit-like protein